MPIKRFECRYSNMNFIRIIFLIILAIPFETKGQITRDRDLDQNPEYSDTLINREADSNYVVPDTTIIDYFSIDNIKSKKAFNDSLIDSPFSQIDFARRDKADLLTLGNPGSASYSIYPKISATNGFDHGLHQYDLYRLENDSLKYFDLNRPITNVFFSPGTSQQNFLVKAAFSRRFSKGITALIDYYRINQQGLYQDQKARHTVLGVGLWYKSKNGRFNSFFSYIGNALNEENNGGVSNETLFDDPNYAIRLSIPVTLSDANTRHETREYTLNNILRLNQPISNNEYSLRHEFVYQIGTYKFADESTAGTNDASYYQEYLIDDRGLRFFLKNNRLENSFYMYSKWAGFGDVRIGLTHAYNNLDLDITKESINNLFASFRSNVNLSKGIKLNGEAALGLMDYAGDFQIKGKLSIENKLGDVNVGVHFKRNKSPLIASQLIINNQVFYQNEFTRPLSLDLFARLTVGQFNVSFSQLTIQNPIFWDSRAIPQQGDGTYSSSRFTLDHSINFGILHIDNYLFYQLFTEDLFYLPDFFTKHEVYLKSQIFRKRMLFKSGLDIRLLSEYAGPAYMPLNGQFYKQDENTFGFYPEVDFHFTFKVDSFRAFFRMNNLTDYIYSGARYQVNRYPIFDANFRFGISWIMTD